MTTPTNKLIGDSGKDRAIIHVKKISAVSVRAIASMLMCCVLVAAVATPSFAQKTKKNAKPANRTAVKKKSTAKRKIALREPAGDRFAAVDAIIEKAVKDGQIPGAVVVVGHNGRVVYRKAFGERSLEPTREVMTPDTVFDMASLTKCMATASSVARMLELGQIRLNDTVVKYLPEFGKWGKEEITIRQLMTHYSGLREDLDLKQPWSGKETAFAMANEEKPVTPPGAQFRYSDINYIVLGELVEKLSGMTLDKYADAHIFQPLGMKETGFMPAAGTVRRVAPSEFDENNHMLRGVVHDPTARRMGGVAGHAGLFSTADDVAKFALAMLDGSFPLSPATVQKMTTPQQAPTATAIRGLGWDIDSPFASNRGELLPVGSFGHTGFTGTSLWMDGTTNTFVAVLTNAVHPRLRPGSPAVAIRTKVASAVAAALSLEVPQEEKIRLANITGYNEAMVGTRRVQWRNGQVKTGLDVLVEQNFAKLQSDSGGAKRRIGVLTNQTGVDAQGRRTIDLLAKAPGIELVAIFSPEHGVTGAVDTTDIANTKDQVTGVPVYSVYGAKDEDRRPKAEQLKGLDAVVIDLQDAGVRFYTYETTMGYFLEAAAQSGTEIVVLDRPDPINGAVVQGPVSIAGKSFVNYHPLPVRHGMTMGELAKMFNAERNINAKLTVVPLQGWQRGDWFDATGQVWVNPSPNLRSVTESALYPGVALVEGTNVSVGRGTDTPFEVMGAPWIDPKTLSDYLNSRMISGVRFVPVRFTPKETKYAGQLCGGVNIVLMDRNALDGPELGVELAVALRKFYPQQWDATRLDNIIAHPPTSEMIMRMEDPRRIADEWREGIEGFNRVRGKYLMY
jgi:uncharacterized protein YbbC (DUF1343 family)/CubicO group peptidase (beta-lactamase class C family)